MVAKQPVVFKFRDEVVSNSVFREEAVAHQKNRLHGEVIIVPSVASKLTTIFLSTWVLLLIFWLTTNTYAKKESAIGWIEPDDGLLKVYAKNSIGKVKDVLVEEGESVKKDQPLVIINGDRILEDGTNLEDALLAQYLEQKSLLTNQIKHLEEKYILLEQDALNQFNSSALELEQIQQQISTITQRLSLLRQKRIKFEKMSDKGNVSQIDLANVKEKELSLKNELQSYLRTKIKQQDALSQLETRLQVMPSDKLSELDSYKSRINDISQKIFQLKAARGHIIRAPRDGFVTNLDAYHGQQTNAVVPLMSIVPKTSNMIAKILVPARSAGFIEKELEIDLRYDAFPYQKFGVFNGVISKVGNSVLLPLELKDTPITVKEPVYMVEAELENQQINAFGKTLQLKSGMTFSVDVTLHERNLIEWLFEPLLSLSGKV